MSKPTYEELEQRIRALEQTEIGRKKAEKALKESEERFQAIFEQAAVGVAQIVSKTGDFAVINQRYADIVGYTIEEMEHLTFQKITHPDDLQEDLENMQRLLNGEINEFSMDKRYYHKNGSIVWVNLTVFPMWRIGEAPKYHVAVVVDITKRKQAEEALITEKLISEEYINSLPALFYVFDEQRFVRWNSGWNRISGYSNEELASMYGTDFFEGKDKVLINERMLKTFREGAADAEAKFITKDGQRIPYYFTGLRKKLNGKDHLIGLGIDITDRKQAEEALRESEEQFRSLIHRIQAAVVVHGPDTQITASNPKAQELLGLTEKQMLGKTVTDKAWKFHRADGKEMSLEEYPVNRVLATQQPLRDLTAGVCLSEKDDMVWVLVNANPVFDDKRNIQQVIVSFVDISDRKQTEEKLRKITHTLSEAQKLAHVGSWDWDLETDEVVWSNEVYHIFGLDPEHFQPRIESVMNRFHPDDRAKHEELIKKSLANKESYSFETRILLPNGTIRKIVSTAQGRYDNEGKLIRILGTVHDITDLKQAEEDKRKALEFAAEQSRHALIGQVAGKMAHDFNNVLMGIMGNAQLAMMDCDDENIKVMLEHINEFSQRGRDITNNLLSYSKDQEPKQTYFTIEDKIELVLKMLKKDMTGIEISRNYEPGISELLADPGMIQDALVNIIQNSIHAMSKVENPILNLKAYSQDDKVYFEIEDNGCGIPKEHQESIYTPSFTLKGSHDETGSYKSEIKGTGYGMSNVKKYIVEKHKGSIFLESEVGKGTKITVALRIIKDHLSSDEKKEVAKSEIYDKRRILLVEDEPAIADVQYQILTKEPFGHIVSIAANGQIAIDTFNRNKFDVVSLDYMLPGNINGLDVYNHIRKNDKDIPVMFISGNIEFLESMKKLKEKDPNLEYLSKPIDNLDYVNKINELAGRST